MMHQNMNGYFILQMYDSWLVGTNVSPIGQINLNTILAGLVPIDKTMISCFNSLITSVKNTRHILVALMLNYFWLTFSRICNWLEPLPVLNSQDLILERSFLRKHATFLKTFYPLSSLNLRSCFIVETRVLW